MKFIKIERFQGIVFPLGLLLFWFLAAHLGWIDKVIFPPPEKVFKTAIELFKKGDLIGNVQISLFRVLTGFFLGTAAGLIFGAAIGFSRGIEKLFAPLFHAIRQVPLLGWIPLIILWCGIGEASKIVLIGMSAFYPVVLNTFEGIRSVKKEYIEVAQVFEFSRRRLLWDVILPSAMPQIFTGIRLSLGKSWMLVVGAEIFIVAKGGIGDMMWEARDRFHMDIVLVGLITVGLVGFAFNQIIALIESRFLIWR